MTTNFTAQVKGWTEKAKRNPTLVFKQAAQNLVDEVLKPKQQGGNMPVDTGNLRRSLMASTSRMPVVESGRSEFPDNGGQINLTIAGATERDTIYFGFQAAYAMRMEYGFTGQDSLGRNYNQTGNRFVGLAVDRWQQIVDKAAKEIGS